MLVYGCDFSEALSLVAEQMGINTDKQIKLTERSPVIEVNEKQQPDKIGRLKAHLRHCKPITEHSPVGRYLIARGLNWDVIQGIDNLYYHAALDYWTFAHDKPVKVGTYPAMIAAIKRDGELMGLHTTYLQKGSQGWHKVVLHHTETVELLPAKKMYTRYIGALRGAAIPLYSIESNAIAVCEGIETALAVKQMFGLPVWACCSASGVRQFSIPKDVQQLFIISDNDANNTGQEATRHLANRAIQQGLEVKQWIPPTVGHDALDELIHRSSNTSNQAPKRKQNNE